MTCTEIIQVITLSVYKAMHHYQRTQQVEQKLQVLEALTVQGIFYQTIQNTQTKKSGIDFKKSKWKLVLHLGLHSVIAMLYLRSIMSQPQYLNYNNCKNNYSLEVKYKSWNCWVSIHVLICCNIPIYYLDDQKIKYID